MVISAIIFLTVYLCLTVKLCKDDYISSENNKDSLYNSISIIMAITAVICILIAVYGVYRKGYNDVKEKYNYYRSSKAEEDYEYYDSKADYYQLIGDYDEAHDYQIEALVIVSGQLETMEKSLAEYVTDHLNIKRYYTVQESPEFYGLCSTYLVLGLLYFLFMIPAKIARRTDHSQKTAIIWLNALLGETIIVWIIMLIWSNSENKGSNNVSDKFAELSKLKEKGLISEAEFEAKRKELLEKI